MLGNLFFLRLAVAVIFIYHSVPKLQSAREIAAGMGWKPGQVFGLGLIEFISAVGIVGGVGVRLGAFLLFFVMAGAIYHKTSIWKIPFMSQSGTGWEFDLILLAANMTIYMYYS